MASRYNRSGENSMKPIHFFKIILARSLHEGKLKIPTAFVKKFAKGLSESVILKLPNGEEWKVNLAKHDGDVWLENGWKEFANYYCLTHGHLLVFRYEIPSCFQVIIFNMNALEINYPSQEVEDKEESNDVEEYQPCKKRKDSGSAEFSLRCKMRRIHEDDGYETSNNLQMKCKRKKCKEGTQGLLTSKLQKSKVPQTLQLPVTTSKSNKALDRANAFKSNNPFFIVVMHRSYIHSTANLSLPSHFAKQYFDSSQKRGNVILKVNERVWHLKYLVRNNGTGKKFELSGGWRAFRNDNNLNERDICIFELIGRNEIAFRVFIFQHSDGPECLSSQVELKQHILAEKRCVKSTSKFSNKASCKDNIKSKGMSTSKFLKCKMSTRLHPPVTPTRRNRALDRANAFKSHNPFFLVVLQQSYIHSRVNLHVPSKFARQYFDWDKMGGNIILRMLNGSIWPARYNIRLNRGAPVTELSSGWREFAAGNKLDVDDVCLFELIDRIEIIFQVFIFRQSDCPNSTLTQGKLKQLTPAKRTILQRTKSCYCRPHDVIGEFGSKFPFFRVKINANHIKKGCMIFPRGFVKDHFQPITQFVTLKVGVRSWRVSLLYYSKTSRAFFSAGWRDFVRQNALEVGDICFFELLTNDDITMEVSILKQCPVLCLTGSL